MAKEVIGSCLLILGVLSALAGAMMSMTTSLQFARFRAKKAPRALGHPADALNRHPNIHPLQKRNALAVWLAIIGAICFLIGFGILINS
jgi:hypothetical protein